MTEEHAFSSPMLPGMPGEVYYPYSDLLQTPRPNIIAKNPDLIAEPLLESQAYKLTQAAYNTSEKTFDDKYGAAIDFAALTRKTLWYKTSNNSATYMSPETVAKDNETNCYGYTIVLSELLHTSRIDHYIAFTNSHTFVLFKDVETNQVKMIDSITRKFDGDITEALTSVDFDTHLAQGQKFASTKLDTTKLLQLRGLATKMDEMTAKSPWLALSDTLSPRSGSMLDHVLQVRIFTQEKGKEVLQAYSDALISLNINDYESAITSIKKLDGMFPDVDPRSGLGLAGWARGEFINNRNKKWGSAMILAEVIANSLSHDKYSESTFFASDTARAVANELNNPDLMQYAIELLESASVNSKIKQGKLEKMKTQLARMSLAKDSVE